MHIHQYQLVDVERVSHVVLVRVAIPAAPRYRVVGRDVHRDPVPSLQPQAPHQSLITVCVFNRMELNCHPVTNIFGNHEFFPQPGISKWLTVSPVVRNIDLQLNIPSSIKTM